MQGKRMIGENDLRVYLDKWDKKYWATYKVLDILQKVFYRSVVTTGLNAICAGLYSLPMVLKPSLA